jgi:hypothetical protein
MNTLTPSAAAFRFLYSPQCAAAAVWCQLNAESEIALPRPKPLAAALSVQLHFAARGLAVNLALHTYHEPSIRLRSGEEAGQESVKNPTSSRHLREAMAWCTGAPSSIKKIFRRSGGAASNLRAPRRIFGGQSPPHCEHRWESARGETSTTP